MAKIGETVTHNSGIPLGGIGTGTVEIRPDGYFHEWQIFNLGPWAPNQPEFCKVENPEMAPGALAFYVRTKTGRGAALVRNLGLRTDQCLPYHMPWRKNVRKIDFDGSFPVARLKYHAPELPVTLSSAMFSPFIPHDSKTSGTPGLYAVFTAKNTGRAPVEVSLLATMKNPLAWKAPQRMLTNTVTQKDGCTYVSMKTGADIPCKATLGSMCLSVKGGEASWIGGEYARFFRGYGCWGSAYGFAHESFFHDFRELGRLPSLSANTAPSGLLRIDDAAIEAMPLPEKQALIEQILQHPFAHALLKRIREIDPSLPGSDGFPGVFLKEIRTRLDVLAGKERAEQGWGDAALCSTVTLKPGEQRDIVFALGWHFPYHFSAIGPLLGHMYENWFGDATAVTEFLSDRYESHKTKVFAFSKALFDTTAGIEMPEAWSGQLTTLTKNSWWIKNGDFGIWEGLGCCGFHTTDVSYYGTFSILALFPDLQKYQMVMGTRMQRDDGRVHHFFTPDFTAVDWHEYDRVDMNMQFTLMVCRDYLWSGDKDYLNRLWPCIVKAMENSKLLDADGDGLPDHDTRRNTYDAWNFFGTPSFISSLWLAALKAGVCLAAEVNDAEHASSWQAILQKGLSHFDKKLWNGKYYSLWVDGKKRDECCMSDQVNGEWYTAMMGIGGNLPRARVRAALRAIFKHNYNPEDGLVNAMYPPNTRRFPSTWRNYQAVTPWSGIEYAIASMMLEFGMVREAYMVVRTVHERYMNAGRFWNHHECGEHYYRPMSSWAMLLSLSGFKVDMAHKSLTIRPIVERALFKSPWASTTAWGTLTQTKKKLELRCLSGTMEIHTLKLNLALRKCSVYFNKKKLEAESKFAGGTLTVTLKQPSVLKEGEAVTVEG